MKKIEIYKENELQLSAIVTEYEINTYVNSFEIVCKIEEIEITYSIPLNKGYKIIAEV
jgi:hypothetical protein